MLWEALCTWWKSLKTVLLHETPLWTEILAVRIPSLYPFYKWENYNFLFYILKAQTQAWCAVNTQGKVWRGVPIAQGHPPFLLPSEVNPTGRWAVGLGGESEVSHPDFSEGSGLRFPGDLPTCVFGAPRPSQRFTPPCYSEMNHFCFFQLATTGPPGSLERRRLFLPRARTRRKWTHPGCEWQVHPEGGESSRTLITRLVPGGPRGTGKREAV